MLNTRISKTTIICPPLTRRRQLTIQNLGQNSHRNEQPLERGSSRRQKTARYFEQLSLQAYLLNIKMVTKMEPELRSMIHPFRSSVRTLKTKYLDQSNKRKRINSPQYKSRRMYDIEEAKPQTQNLKTLIRALSEDSQQYGTQNTRTRGYLKTYQEPKYIRRLRLRRIFRRMVWAIHSLRKLMRILPEYSQSSEIEKKKSKSKLLPIKEPLIELIQIEMDGEPMKKDKRRKPNVLNPLVGTRIQDYIELKSQVNSQVKSPSPRSQTLKLKVSNIKNLTSSESYSIMSTPKSSAVVKSQKFRYLQIGKDYGTEIPFMNLDLRKKSSPLNILAPRQSKQHM